MIFVSRRTAITAGSFGLAAAAVALVASPAFTAELEVKMLNKGAKGEMVFEPDVVCIAPGDTVNFIVVDRGNNHVAVSIRDMIPEGAEPFKGEPDIT